MQRSAGLYAIALLALTQAVFGALRSLELFQIGSDLFKQGLLIMPLVGTMAYARGLFIGVVVSLYVAFAVGSFMGRGWASSAGMVAAIINLLLVLGILIRGEFVLQGLLWSVIPVLILWYLLSFARGEPIVQ